MSKKIQLMSISEKELEACLKCSICTVYCPVSGVTTRYPGPKQAGPDGERYRMKDPRYYDDKALKMCLNCKRCEVACPQGVQIGDIIQSARIRYAPYARSWRPFPFLRETLLCNTDFVGTMATKMAPIVNTMLSIPLFKTVFMHGIMSIDQRRTMPKYASQTFRKWFIKNCASEQRRFPHQVGFFHGCYVNYNYPQLGKDLVKVMNAIGYGVQLLEGEKCCGVAKITNSMPREARRQGVANMAAMRKATAQGMDIIATGSTCTFTMREEYDHLLNINNDVARKHLSLATRYIFRLVDSGKVKLAFRSDYRRRLAYHTACHMERLGWAIYSTELIKMIPGVDLVILDSQCCGIGGTYGFKVENYGISQKIGTSLFRQITNAHADYVVCDCETCKWQIEMSTQAHVMHPISILAEALDVEETRRLNGFA
ncbi:MAG: anaerobic glycerol-3-phosphate dehydrogenase subunit C [Paraprevotella sp.]|nr:anaerobic glycerol-3-phosphate dehydrogenase subunit C [Paraprevotella sp.]